MTASWGALLRLARRDARRHPRRAALVVLLVALPVAGLVAAGTLALTVRPSGAERATAELGAADLAAYPVDLTGDELAPPAGLPAGSRVEPIWRGELPVGGAPVPAIGVDLTGLGAGMFEVTEGTAPAPGSGQLALTEPLARRLGVGVGDQVQTGSGTARVAGIVRDPLRLDRQAVVVDPAAVTASGFLIGLPAGTTGATATGALARAGWVTIARADLARVNPEELVTILVLGGFGFLVTSLVTAAAFAVSAQRRRHDLALLAATGADTRQLRRSVLSSALLLGAGGTALGLLLGVLLPAATLPWLERWSNQAVDGLAVSPALLIAAGGLGVVVALASAWFTARSAGRTPVAAALTGRQPPRAASTRLLVAGLVAVGLGVALTVASAAGAASEGSALTVAAGVVIGAALTMLGLGAISPWLLEQFARWTGSRLPIGVRLAIRDMARFRSRTGPIMTAIVAGLGLSIAVGAALETVEAGLARDYRPQLAADQLLVDGTAPAPLVSQLREDLPVAADSPVTIVAPASTTAARSLPQYVTVADARLLDTLDAPPAATAALAAGDVLVLHDPAHPAEPLVRQAELIAPGRVTAVELPLAPEAVPGIVLSPETFERTGASRARELTRWLIRLTGPVEPAQLQHAQQLAGRFGQRVTVETGPPEFDSGGLQAGATAAAGVLSLLIVGVGLALVSQEARRDESVLTAVGAAPQTRRSLAAARAGTLTLLGGVLAVPAGLLPIWGLSAASGIGAASELIAPAASIVAVIVVVPALAAAAAWLATRPGPTTLPLSGP